jgi:hypothetical protein
MDKAIGRGVAISLGEPLPTPPTVLHYEPGPLTLRQFDRHGQPWLAAYEAQHDGVGWLVVRAFCRPLVMMPGDFVHIRAQVLEDHGSEVMVEFAGRRGSSAQPIPRGLIVFLEETPATA